MSHNQFALLREKRFLPFFITQVLGVFNDNAFKHALVTLISFKSAESLDFDSTTLVNLAALLFILPFFLFSAVAGQFAEKYEKSLSIRRIKLFEIFLMLMTCLGFYLSNLYLLLTVLFFMGFQSSLFGPLKYGYLPQKLEREELVGGNALVETSTFMSILLGVILAGIFIKMGDQGILYLCITLLFCSSFGFIASLKIPQTPSVVPNLKINWNIFSETYKNIQFTQTNKIVFQCILGIAWFWFYGSVYLTQIPNYTRSTLAGDESVATLILAGFCLGIGIGSIITEKLSAGRIEVGLVPIGALGLSYFGYDIYLANAASGLEPIYNYIEFIKSDGGWRVLFDAAMLGASGGLFTVPLYAQIQHLGDKKHISRLIAGLNIMSALFMSMAALLSALLLQYFTIPQLFWIISIMNVVVAFYIFYQVPEFIFRLITWLLVNTIYRIRTVNLNLIPKHGACVLVCNHVSFVDALIIGGYCKRNVRFVMYHKIFKAPVIGSIFRMAKAIPIAPAHEDRKLMKEAFDKIARTLENGEVVCIFPEGKLTANGKINEFKSGIEKIIDRTAVPVIPMALKNLWGSWFSRYNGGAMKGIPKKFMAKITLVVGKSVQPERVNAKYLHEKVKELQES